MNSLLTSILLTGGGLLSSCAGYERGLVLDPVGPSSRRPSTLSENGSLVVYSAFDVHANFTSTDPDRRQHTDYRIFYENGNLRQIVHNDTHTILEGPVQVALPAGAYRIIARANGYGVVTVPVVIEANRVTSVHLEGGGSWSKPVGFSETNAVRLPDGNIVGWRAIRETTAKGVND